MSEIEKGKLMEKVGAIKAFKMMSGLSEAMIKNEWFGLQT